MEIVEGMEMEILSMIFVFVGIVLSINLIVLFISSLKKRRIPAGYPMNLLMRKLKELRLGMNFKIDRP